LGGVPGSALLLVGAGRLVRGQGLVILVEEPDERRELMQVRENLLVSANLH
jgi:hypothetical protein